jgi:hypothetical protein
MRLKTFVLGCAALLGTLCGAANSQADEWGKYYHYPYNYFQQYYWSPYDYQPVYDYQYRYPQQMRVVPKRHGWRSWHTQDKPWHRGYHFVLDVF